MAEEINGLPDPRPNFPVAPQSSPHEQTKKPPSKRRRIIRKILIAFGAMIVVVAMALLFTPAILSTSAVRHMIVRQVNKGLNGRIEIADYSLSWGSGIHAEGIKLYDARGGEVLGIGSVSTELTLVNAIRGDLALGETAIRDLVFAVRKNADGTTNLSDIARPDSADTEKTKESGSSSTLPKFSGHLQIVGWHGTITSAATEHHPEQVAIIESFDGDIKIPSADAPINHQFDLVARSSSDSKPATLSIIGSASLIHDQHITPDSATGNETVTFDNIDLTSLAGFVPPSIRRIAGIAAGKLTLDMAGGKTITAAAKLDVRHPVVVTDSFKGDESAMPTHVEVNLPATTLDTSAGFDHYNAWAIKLGDGLSPQVIFSADRDGSTMADVRAVADVTVAQLMSLIANEKPSGNGTVSVTAHVDAARTAPLMPLRKEVTVASGELTYALNTGFSNGSWSVTQTLESTPITGQNTDEKKTIAIQPIRFSTNTTGFGGGWSTPDLRDLQATVRYGGEANPAIDGRFEGKSLATINGALHARLADLRNDAAQFIDLKDKTIDGTVAVTAVADVTPTTKSSPTNSVKLQMTIPELKLRGVGISDDRQVRSNIVMTVRFSGSTAQEPAGTVHIDTDTDLHHIAIDRFIGGAPVATAVNDERVHLIANVAADSSFSQLSINKLDADGSMLGAHETSGVIWLKSGTGKDVHSLSTLQMVRDLALTIQVPDVAKVQALLDAITPPASSAAVASAAGRDWVEAARGRRVRLAGRRDGRGMVWTVAQSKAAPAGTTEKAVAKPPVKLTRGSVTVQLNVKSDDRHMSVQPEFECKQLAIAVGAADYTVGDVNVHAKAILASADIMPTTQSDESTLQQIRQISITELLAQAAGSTVTLTGEPIVISNPASFSAAFAAPASQPSTAPAAPPASMNASISATGDVASLSNLLDALGGDPQVANYTGAFDVKEKLTLANGLLQVDGQGAINNFVALEADHKTPGFTEKVVRLENSVSLDNRATADAGTLSISKLRLAMDTSKAADVSLTGVVRDIWNQRLLENVNADLTYDWAQLWPIAHPLVVPAPGPDGKPVVDRLKDLKITGKGTQRFALSGSYPASVPFSQAVAHLTATGGVNVETLDAMGLSVQKLSVPIWLDRGVLRIARPPTATSQPTSQPTALCNSGTIDFSGLTVDLTTESPLLSIPANLSMLNKIAMNPVLATNLNDFFPVFDAGDSATGNLTLTVNDCNRVPVELLTSPASAGQPKIDLSTSFEQIQLGDLVGKVGSSLKSITGLDLSKYVRGDVTNSRFIAGGGLLNVQEFVLTGGVSKRKLVQITGTVGLDPPGKLDLKFTLSPELLGAETARIVPGGITIPIGGTKSAPQFEVQSLIRDVGVKAAGDQLLNLLGGKKKKQPDPQPGQ